MGETESLPTLGFAPAEPARLEEGATSVVPVGGGCRMRDFLQAAETVYADDPAWIKPLSLERRLHLSSQNPFTKHAHWQAWVAWQDDRPVGRITAQVDALHRRHYGSDTGHIGFIEGLDDASVFRGLTLAAEDWLAREGTRRISGPFNLSINQECGVLVDGFDRPPAFLMPHGRPWFANHLEALDYRPVRDLFAYIGATDFAPPRTLQALAHRFQDRIHVRPMGARGFKRDLEALRGLFNDAWTDNYGFVPFTRAEFDELGLLLRVLGHRDCIQIAELDGEPAAFNLGIPDINQAIKDLNGRLFPTAWLRLLWRIKRNRVPYGRVPLMGVRGDLQNTPLGTALIWGVMVAVKDAFLARGIETTEMSWILEDNKGMRKMAEQLGGRAYKRYRLYEKTIEPCNT